MVMGAQPQDWAHCLVLSPTLPTVRPDPPQNLTVWWQGEQLLLTWAPPLSWPLPKSYFALVYRLQYELPNGTQVTAGCLYPPCHSTYHHTSSLCCAYPALCPLCSKSTLHSAHPALCLPTPKSILLLLIGTIRKKDFLGAQQWSLPHDTASLLRVLLGVPYS